MTETTSIGTASDAQGESAGIELAMEAARRASELTRQLDVALGGRLKPGPSAEAALAAGMEAVADIAPESALEGMLATQIVATQNLAMTCLGNAAAAEDARVFAIAAAAGTKLMRGFAQQVELLRRLRGQQRSTVRVEHVEVAAGGGTKLTGAVERVR